MLCKRPISEWERMSIFETIKITQVYVYDLEEMSSEGQAKYIHFKIGNYCSAFISLFYIT